MWNAIKSDLVSFVSTVKEDTVKAVSSVMGDQDDVEEGQDATRKRRLLDLTREYKTYADPIEDAYKREYLRFRETFRLPSKAGIPRICI